MTRHGLNKSKKTTSREQSTLNNYSSTCITDSFTKYVQRFFATKRVYKQGRTLGGVWGGVTPPHVL
jgi:hypothetical protein